MGRAYDTISDPLRHFIDEQPMFFVATAPLSNDGHVNVSPKGMDTLRVLDSNTVAYVDLIGSGVETIAHLRDNGRITLLWCSFGPTPRILRVYGRGTHLPPGSARFDELANLFPAYRAVRSIIEVSVDRVADSCGFGVPEMDLIGQRSRLIEWADNRSDDQLDEYVRERNDRSIDGLPGWDG
ncbi:MAG: pyridoxamine 5'-phosphate oxidase family protein [Acidimicrobiia bacterium]|nr:pyridoxamine 5'-phosphate oxidase family protein [Acidimicrobiia bacterium]